MKTKIIFTLIIFCLLPVLISASPLQAEEVEELDYQLLNSYPHDPQAFTQGLEVYNGFLYEGTGLYGSSSLRKVEIKSGQVIKKIELEPEYFGEGITILNEKIYQLSWKEEKAFVYDLDFNLVQTFNYQGEGWGLANNGEQLIMSDGSEFIYFRDPNSFEITDKVAVTSGQNRIKNINELEYQDGYIYANIWQTDYIVKINPQTGKLRGLLDLSNILEIENPEEIDVLNGIAFDPEEENFLVTGKLWPKLFRIEIID